jgi:hypothetical protein
MKKLNILLLLSIIIFGFSCQKIRNCECKTTWVDYTTWGNVNKEKVVAYPVKGTKKEAKTQCDILATNQANTDGYYTTCEVK